MILVWLGVHSKGYTTLVENIFEICKTKICIKIYKTAIIGLIYQSIKWYTPRGLRILLLDSLSLGICSILVRLGTRRGKRGGPRRRWLGRVRNDIRETGQSEEEVYNCTTWVSANDPHIKVGIR